MIGAIQSSVAGLNTAAAKIDRAASDIAKNGTGGDLTRDIVDLSIAKVDYKANAIVLETIDDMQKDLLHTLDIKA